MKKLIDALAEVVKNHNINKLSTSEIAKQTEKKWGYTRVV